MYKLIDEAAASREPVCITGKPGNAISPTEEDWLGVNGMRESILQGLATPLDECSEEPGW
uniref:Prevent-host-death family protein n=1 Tax=Geobacter sp. (strain M21) TaxID=443144 RepID=C6E297_GEOSM